MSSIGDRISECIKDSGLTKTAFATRIDVSQPFISQLCAGTAAPSDRTIRDICREFNINEMWLRTGEGDMHVPITRSQEIADFVGKLLKGEGDTFKRRFIAMLARLDENEWKLLEQKALELAEGSKKD